MANQFRIERPEAPVFSSATHTPTDLNGEPSSSTSLRSSYGLLPVDSPHKTHGLNVIDTSSPQKQNTTAQNSTYGPEKSTAANEDATIFTLRHSFPTDSEANNDAETTIDRATSTLEGDVSSYGGAPGMRSSLFSYIRSALITHVID